MHKISFQGAESDPTDSGYAEPSPGAAASGAALQDAMDAAQRTGGLPSGLRDTLGRVHIRFANNPPVRWLMRHVITPLAAFLIVTLRLFGVRKTPSNAQPSATDIAMNWRKAAAAFKVDTIVEQASDDEVILVQQHCAMGFSSADHRCLCDASMNMDHEIVRRLGGELTILHRRLDGGEDCCRHRIRLRKEPPSED